MVSRNAFEVPSTGDQAAHRSVSAKDGAAASTAKVLLIIDFSSVGVGHRHLTRHQNGVNTVVR